jgi:hypothetical protein
VAVQNVLVIWLLVECKWRLIGERKPNNYDWDKSPYCQLWQLFLKFEILKKATISVSTACLECSSEFIGISCPYFRAMGARIGRDCALFADGLPHLIFTKPELLTLGDRVSKYRRCQPCRTHQHPVANLTSIFFSSAIGVSFAANRD